MEERALRNYEKYFDKPEGSVTIAEIEAMPGGVEEWSKEDVLEIVVGSKESSLKRKGQVQGYDGAGAINQSNFVDETDYAGTPGDGIKEGLSLKVPSLAGSLN